VPLQILWQQTGEERTALSSLESFLPEGKGERQGNSVLCLEPLLAISKPEASRIILFELPNSLGVQKNIK
jgi:hypothetical protein